MNITGVAHHLRHWSRRLGALAQPAPGLYGINRRNVELVYAHNPRRHYPLVDDKLKCKALLEEAGVPVAKTVLTCGSLFEVPKAVAALKSQNQFVVKPAGGSGGSGILVVGAATEQGWLDVRTRLLTRSALQQHMANIVFGAYSKTLYDRVLIEERLTQHAVLQSLWSEGVSDLRILLLAGEPFMAMLRVPTQRSAGKANLHQGGVGIAVNLATGRTERASIRGKVVTQHPDNGAILAGVMIPDWDRVLSVARRCASAVPLGYLGVDIVIDAAGTPRVLELNARPGLEVQNVNGQTFGAALKQVRS